MAIVSGSGRAAESRSGREIVTERRTRPDTQPPQESPNWLTRVIFPATRRIATGAVKILSSVFDSSSSSSSSSSSEVEAASEDDVNNDEVNHSNKGLGISSETMKCMDREPPLSLFNSMTKTTIERLLRQEKFSWEERNRLIQVIDSRVMDSIVGGEEDGLLGHVPTGDDTADLCNKAVIEARKWLEEKKSGLSPVSNLAKESHGFNSELQNKEKEAGSPVDVAKLYMRSRPLWASPLAEYIEVQSPAALRRELFGDVSLSSSKKRNFESGSWNIEEEIRRVRSKASEDMLCSIPSSKIDLSSFATAPKPFQDSLIADISTSREDVGNELNFMRGTPFVDASLDATVGLNTSVGISASNLKNMACLLVYSALELREDGLENETMTSHPATTLSEQYQNSEIVKVAGECADPKPSYLTSLDLAREHSDDPRSSHRNVCPVEEVREFEGIENINGLHSSQERSLSGEVCTREIQGQPEENSNAFKSDVKTTNSSPLEDMCELLSEASVEVPIVDETNGIVSVSQTSSSMHYEELSPVVTQPYTTKLVSKANDVAVKQEVKKPGRYNRRGRGRGK